MIIEDLVSFDKNSLSFWKIILPHQRKWVLVLTLGVSYFLILANTLVIILIDQSFFLYSGFPSVMLIWFLMVQNRKETSLVLKNIYTKYLKNRELNSWNHTTICYLQYKLIERFLNDPKRKVKSSQIRSIIDELKRESEKNQYQPISLGLIIGILLSATNTMILTILNQVPKSTEFSIYASIVALLIFAIVFSVALTDFLIAKPIILANRKKYHRLIRALENYLINN